MNLAKMTYPVSLFLIGIGLAANAYSQSFLTNGLTAYYPFNGNANDASGNGNTGTVDGATLTTDRFGIPNSAYSFNGVSSDILVPETVFGPTNAAWTVSLWITFDGGSYAAQTCVLAKSPVNGQMGFTILANQVWFGVKTASQGNYLISAPLVTNSVMHVVGVYQKGQSISLYINGLMVTNTPVPNENLWVEAYPSISALGSFHYTPGPYQWFRGTLDDFRVYTRALSASEVQQLYAYESVPPPSYLTNGLVAYYPFNGNANDASGNGNNGITYGVVSTTNRFGTPNGAYYFNGLNAYIDFGSPALLAFQSNFTVTSWCWFNGGTANPRVLNYGQDYGYELLTMGTGVTRQFRFESGYGVYAQTTNYYPQNMWMQVVGVRSNGFAFIYVNGILAASGQILQPSYPSGLQVGQMSTANFWGGSISDIRIYNRDLSGSEVQQLYAYESVPPPCIPHTATATASVAYNFLVEAAITDFDCGYTNTPGVRVIGGDGSGAQAAAVVSNGVVIAVNVMNAGSGYTSTPAIVIEPPFIEQPTLGLAAMSLLSFTNLAISTNYQLQAFDGNIWSSLGAAFTAIGPVSTQYVSGTVDPSGYRLVPSPVPLPAYAIAMLSYGFVVHAAVTSGGSGYATTPAVSIVGGGGSNATAVAQISGGRVTGITITDAGIGYTTTPTVAIDPPTVAALSPTGVLPVMRLDSANLAPYDNYQIQSTPTLGGAWANWNGGSFSPTGVTNSQFLLITNSTGLFRLQYVP